MGLVGPSGRDSRIEVLPVDPTPKELLSMVVRWRPEIVVVDPAWLVLADLLRKILVVGGCGSALCVVGSATTSDVLKIRAARSGFFDIVDLSRPGGEVLEHLRESLAGESRLSKDRLWNRIQLETESIQISEVAGDRIDEEIVELLSIGLSDRDISSGVHLSLQAVRNRVSAMLERSGCANRTQLGWVYTSHKLIEVLCADVDGVSER